MSIFAWNEQELSSEEAAARGHRAEQIMYDPVFVEALAEAEQTFVHEWLGADSTAVREAAHAKVHALQEIRNRLAAFVADAAVMPKRPL